MVYRIVIPVSLAALLLVGAGCVLKTPAPSGSANTNAEVTATTTPDTAATSTTETNVNANINAPAAAPKPTTTNKPTSTAVKKTFYVELDDSGAYPASGTAAKGSTVTVTFKVRPTNVFYNGLVVKSNTLDLGKITAGQSKTVTFTAVEDTTFVAQWTTGTVKARWTLIVR